MMLQQPRFASNSTFTCALLQHHSARLNSFHGPVRFRNAAPVAAAGDRSGPVMRELQPSTPPLVGPAAPGYSGGEPGFGSTPYGVGVPPAARVTTPLDQIPVAAGSRSIPVAPYVPKTVTYFGERLLVSAFMCTHMQYPWNSDVHAQRVTHACKIDTRTYICAFAHMHTTLRSTPTVK